jgi:TolA-binding protein
MTEKLAREGLAQEGLAHPGSAAPRSTLRRPALFLVAIALLGGGAPIITAPAFGQSATVDSEARLRKVEAEIRALQRQVFPGSDGKMFTPEVSGQATPSVAPGTAASTPVADLLTRMEAVEAQLTRLTAQNEETANRVAQLEAKFAALPLPAPAAAPAIDPAAAAPASAAALTLPAAPAASKPAPKPVATSPVPIPVPMPVVAKPATTAKPAVPVATKPTPQRLAAVQKIVKPATGNAADDEYSYGFRLWEAKFYPEAEQQLQLYVDKYPRDAKISFGRNLLGRSFLDDGKPREAGAWFVKNYQADKNGARAPDSLLGLAEAMRQLKDTNRACIALAEFGEVYPRDAAGRLKSQLDTLRSQVKCD